MENSSSVPILGTILIFVCVGAVVLQVFLSRKESKWPGLVLPIISFFFSVVTVVGRVAFSINTVTQTTTENGEVVEQSTAQIGDMPTTIVMALYTFLLYNIPTIIFMAIYAAVRSKRKKQRALEKMSVQDLG